MTDHYSYLFNKLAKDVEQFAPARVSPPLGMSSQDHSLIYIILAVIALVYMVYRL